MNILVIKSSVFGDNGNSSALVNAQLDALKAQHPQATVVVRDLSTDPVPHLDGDRVSAFFTPPEQRNDEQQAVDAFSLALIDELKAADHIVLNILLDRLGDHAQRQELNGWPPNFLRAARLTLRGSH